MENAAYTLDPLIAPPGASIVIIGMAGAGKTTIGRELAQLIGKPQLDTDCIIEAYYGTDLQTISASMSKEAFLDMESAVICRLRLQDCVISTGGSVVYREESIRRLKKLGPVIYLKVDLPVIIERIARKPERGLAISPGQTVEDLYNERAALYSAVADITVDGGDAPALFYASEMARRLSLQSP
ncbi:MAG: shikimate kinase [Desulfovibrio sp.]|jgi:shikimate kinase|nr:shikimate kinase [Desulfovibrio sp.]